jgi:hypothetical protein
VVKVLKEFAPCNMQFDREGAGCVFVLSLNGSKLRRLKKGTV